MAFKQLAIRVAAATATAKKAPVLFAAALVALHFYDKGVEPWNDDANASSSFFGKWKNPQKAIIQLQS